METPTDERCALCSFARSHAIHGAQLHPRRRRIHDGVPQHCFVVNSLDFPPGTPTATDGRGPERGSMRLPGWEPLDAILGVPMAEAYRHARGFVIWREAVSNRWRWGRFDPEFTLGLTSKTWLHEALAEAVRG